MHRREMLEGQGGRHEDGGGERGERPPRRAPADVNCEAISRGGLPRLSHPAVAFTPTRAVPWPLVRLTRVFLSCCTTTTAPSSSPSAPRRTSAHTRPAPAASTPPEHVQFGWPRSTRLPHSSAPSSSPESSRRLITHACPHPSLSSAFSPLTPTAHHVRRYEIREPQVPTPKARACRQQCLPGVQQRGGHSAPSRAVQTLWLRTPTASQPL